MGVPADRRIDVDMGSAKEKQMVVDYASAAGRSASGFASDLLREVAGIGGGNRRRIPRDRRGYRAAAVMLAAGLAMRELLAEMATEGATIDRVDLRKKLQSVYDTLTEAIAGLQ